MMSSQWGMSHVKNVTRSMRKERPSEMMTSLFVRSYVQIKKICCDTKTLI